MPRKSILLHWSYDHVKALCTAYSLQCYATQKATTKRLWMAVDADVAGNPALIFAPRDAVHECRLACATGACKHADLSAICQARVRDGLAVNMHVRTSEDTMLASY